MPNELSAAISLIQSGQRVFIHGAAATPNALIQELVRQAKRLRDVEIIHIHTEGTAPYCSKELKDSFKVVNLFVGENIRARMDYDQVDYLPCFLSDIPSLFYQNRRRPDVALLSLSPSDSRGFHTLGTSVDIAKAALETSKTVIAQINHQMPRVHGDGFVHHSKITASIEVDIPLPEASVSVMSELDRKIGTHVATLIDDGACLQMGIGAIPNAVLYALRNHRHLGIHTEMASDGLIDLIESGAVDNSNKKIHAGRTVASFLNGSRRLFDYVGDNPSISLLSADYVNNPQNIARNPQVVAINSAIELDLTGQVCADSVGHRIISGVGGQMDFVRGATLSPGGKAVFAITARTKTGRSRIVAQLQQGAGVVTTRSHILSVVTEYGVADLYGKTLNERAKALISIAHPEDRETLRYEWKNLTR